MNWQLFKHNISNASLSSHRGISHSHWSQRANNHTKTLNKSYVINSNRKSSKTTKDKSLRHFSKHLMCDIYLSHSSIKVHNDYTKSYSLSLNTSTTGRIHHTTRFWHQKFQVSMKRKWEIKWSYLTWRALEQLKMIIYPLQYFSQLF